MRLHKDQKNNNVVECPKCLQSLIGEEQLIHKCLSDRKVVDVMYDTCGEYYLSMARNGIAGFHQPNKTPYEDNTTNFLVVSYQVIRRMCKVVRRK